MSDRYTVREYFAPCPRGVEKILADEMRAIGVRSLRPLQSGVSFRGKLIDAYRVLLWSRVASRVLLSLGRVDATDGDALYAAIRAIPWEEHVAETGTIAVDASGLSDTLRNSQFTAVRVKDAVVDRFRDLTGVRPDVDTVNPDLLINVAIRGDKATVSIDLAGTALHRRGYREPGVQVIAPMKESLAAAMLSLAGWKDIAAAGGAFVDPMCGSGTLAIEAAMIAGDIAPGITRSHWGFEGWRDHDQELWDELLAEADDRAEAGRDKIPPIIASDIDPRALTIAAANVKRAGLAGVVKVVKTDLADLVAPEGAKPGLVAVNPPYGERMEALVSLPALYATLGQRLRAGFDGWHLAVITPDGSLDRGLAMHPDAVFPLFNGRIESPVHLYTVDTSASAELELGHGDDTSSIVVSDPAAEAFVNRLTKRYAHRSKWARKAGISCYRIYDADLPDYNVAIDLYQGAGPDAGKRWVHIAEYAPPRDIDPVKASMRLSDVLAVVPTILDVDAKNVFLKVRERARGGSQYGVAGRNGVVGQIEEGGLLFEVNFSDYLDTGIFLDHRITRSMIRDDCESKRFLNLFAYTGTATVYAAAGGALSTTTVDLSQTYLDWAGRNLANNGFRVGEHHELVRADVTRWVSEQRRTKFRWDVIFCDPPTFSNSAKMTDTWDVQRDHVELLIGISRLLTRDGVAIFSCNRRGFKLDVEPLEKAGVLFEEITARTVSEDFERSHGGHRCWIVRRAPRDE